MIGAPSVESFLQTMPLEYERAFSPAAIEVHCDIVLGRLPDEVRVALCEAPAGEDAVLCVVADDEPGLLSVVCAAFVSHQLDVRAAQIFARRIPGAPDEAVDFFWVRPIDHDAPASLAKDRVALVQATLIQFLGRSDPDDDEDDPALRAPTARPPAFRPSERSVSMHFDPRSLAEGLSVLVLDAPDTERLLLAVTRALALAGVDIVASEVRTVDDWAHDRFTLQLSNQALDLEVRQRVLAAVNDSFQRPPSPGVKIRSAY